MSNFKIRQSLLGNFDNAEEDKLKKQQFLITNIVEAGYDKQEFAEYMANCKDNGTDIDEWSLIELMDMVHDFQKTHQKLRHEATHHHHNDHEHKEEDKDGPKDSMMDQSQDDIGISKLASPKLRKSIGDNKRVHGEEDEEVKLQFSIPENTVTEANIKRSRTELSYLRKSEIVVTVSDGLVKKGGLFSFSYASYKITLEPLGYNVRRKEEDFINLRKYLCKIYSNQYIPPLILTEKKLTEGAIKKKEKFFNIFLKNLLRNRDLRGSDYLNDFLSIQDHKEFKAKCKLREREKDPAEIYDFYSSSGIADVRSNSEIWKFSFQMPEFISNYTELQKNIQIASKIFAGQAEEMARTVYHLGKYYELLGDIYNQIDCNNMYQVNKLMADIMTTWGNYYIENSQIMKNKFSKFLTYYINEGEPLKELIKKRFNVKENYVKSEIKLLDRKSKLFKSKEYK